MRSSLFDSRSIKFVLAAVLVAFGSGTAVAQQINVTAGPATAAMPDGSSVPMWGYSCGPVVHGSAARCEPLNLAVAPGGWSPVVITVPYTTDGGGRSTTNLTINLTNNLSFVPPGSTTPNNIPTSLTIVGQLGGGLGNPSAVTKTQSPQHVAQGVTWPTANTGPNFTPPAQPSRVQSFATEINVGVTPAAGQRCPAVGTPATVPAGCAALTWAGLRPGTYLIESGTHPSIQGPMGLYGILVVTKVPVTTGTPSPGLAYPGVNYAAEAPLLLSEIDPIQNAAVDHAVRAVGFAETAPWRQMQNQLNAVQIAAPGSGYKTSDSLGFSGGGCTTEPTAAIASVDATGAITGLNILTNGSNCSSQPNITISSTTGSNAVLTASMAVDNFAACGAPAGSTTNATACYPPAVNYTPLYYLINGVAFDKTQTALSAFPTAPSTVASGASVLVRLVNAGLRMHVPALVGSTTGAGGAPGMMLIAEDGNPLPGVPRVQSEVFLPAGKTYDVMINAPGTAASLPVYDRELSLSGNAINRDAGMLAYIDMNGGVPPLSGASAITAKANNDTYNAVVAGKSLTVSDPAKGVIANDVYVLGVALLTPPEHGTVVLNGDGTFTYTPVSGVTSDSFTYCANTNLKATPTCPAHLTATVTLGASNVADSGIACTAPTYGSTMATYFAAKMPGVLAGCTDGAGLPMIVAPSSTAAPVALAGPGTGSASLAPDGSFIANVSKAGTYTFKFSVQNSIGTAPGNSFTATVTFPTANGPKVIVLDGYDKETQITDYRWIIEEDRTFYVDPNCTTTDPTVLSKNSCPTIQDTSVTPAVTRPFVFGTNFHTSSMPVVATGCTGQLSCEGGQSMVDPSTGVHANAVCDVGNGVCRPDTTGNGFAEVDPSQVHLDPTKRYYISVLPGDAATPFNTGYAGIPCGQPGADPTTCQIGHGLGGAPIGKGQTSVMVLAQPSPYPSGKLTAFVFEDDYPLNGEHDAGGGVDVISPQEPGLGGFEITLLDLAGQTGAPTGQPTYDMFNMPLTNALAGTIDPVTGNDACPVSPVITANVTQSGPNATPAQCKADPTQKGCQKGIAGRIVTCPKYESDGVTLSPLAGQVVIANMYPGRYSVVAIPGADRIARGEEWLQTNTLDGQKGHDAFIRIGEPAYFQEFGPAGYHVTIGFANPQIINDRRTNSSHTGMCDPAPTGGGLNCNNRVTGNVTTARMSRVPDERLYGSGNRAGFSFTQCYASLGDPDGADFAFVKCDKDGNFDFQGLPAGNWKITIFDQWNDQIVDGIMQAVGLGCTITTSGLCPPGSTVNGTTFNFGEIAAHQWQANIYTRTCLDVGNGKPGTAGDGVCQPDEPGLPLVTPNVRFRDGTFSEFGQTDLNGYQPFNEEFPLFNWYVIESDSTRFKNTGVHVVYDSGGPADNSSPGGTPCANNTASGAPCGASNVADHLANTYEKYPLPPDLSLPGAVYCSTADCTGFSVANGPTPSSANTHSTGRIDPPYWFGSYGWQGFSGQSNFLEFAKRPFIPGETGGIHGHVVYASTRPFDDPRINLQNKWEPLIANVTVNLYKEGVAADGITPTLTLIDTTQTSSFDAWAQGFRVGADGVTPVKAADGTSKVPNISCPGQTRNDPFFFGLFNQPPYFDYYSNFYASPSGPPDQLPYNAQYKCYDGMHNWNQLQPAPYDGMYGFPSVTAMDPRTGKPTRTNCTACVTNPDAGDPYRYGGSTTPQGWVNGASTGMPMLPAGKYVVEVVVPPGYDLVKEEDKNILIGDNFVAPVAQELPGIGNIFIIPDQAAVGAHYNPNNLQNPTQDIGRVTLPSHEGDTGSIESYWPCVGASRIVPDYISLFPQSTQVSPFAGATRNLCDRKEVTLADQTSAQAKFYLWTQTHVSFHFTGVISDDFTAEFDPFAPQFGEKFSPPYLPVSVKDWTGTEVNRIYADQFGLYNGLNYSTYEVNPPNPTGYAPAMMVMCMNDSGTNSLNPWWDPAAQGPGTSSVNPDPLHQNGYSQFCYELPGMPGGTGYFDTPVTPTSAFSDGFNHPDCNYADATPAIKSVTSSDMAGPWVRVPGGKLTIAALGDQLVDNYGYAGPQSTTAPFNQKKVTRHFGFGTTAGSVVLVGSDGAAHPLTSVAWTDSTITGNVPGGLPDCAVEQQALYGGSRARCGQLIVTAANGKTSVDTVTVTVGGKRPTVLSAGQTIQSAIDAANPGDMIVVPPGIYNEMVLMWKPIRLQGVGAASAIIDANTHPSGKLLDPWRVRINCLFGLTPDGRPRDPSDNACAKGWTEARGGPTTPRRSTIDFATMIIDRLPFEAVLGWDATLNGNLAEQLIEPSLMGAYEGAAITVLGKGVKFLSGTPTTVLDAFGAAQGAAATNVGAAFPSNTVLLSSGTADCGRGTASSSNPYPTNYYCNPSSIDGLGLRNSSQGGGGLFVHAYAHNIQIANNRVYNNTGTLSGGITLGQGEHSDVELAGGTLTSYPGSCESSSVTNLALPFCYNVHANVHHNMVTLNSSLGDELFSSTPAGAGGVSIANGADYYQFTHNWVCGNMSTGDGGGFSHIGWSKTGLIEHNTIIFNQTTNPTITTNGGGLLVMGAPDVDPTCGTNNDVDCLPTPGSVAPSDGTGLGLVINANLILGNSAESGSGGGLRLQHVNGNDVLNFPNGRVACTADLSSCNWNSVLVTNNIIANNVAGWDGGGVSLQDALAVNIVNNTIMSNDSTASSGVLFGSLFAPLASSPGQNCTTNNGSSSCPQVAGLVSVTNSPILVANINQLPAGSGFSCPTDHGSGGSCKNYSAPLLYNDVIWQNRSFFIGVGNFGSASNNENQQKVVALYNAFTTTPAASQPHATAFTANGDGSIITGGTGACPSGASYWDIGVRGDLGPHAHTSGFRLAPNYSVLFNATDYPGANNSGSNPTVLTQYCNGSRVPPEDVCMDGAGHIVDCSWSVPPGTNETNALPTPVFSLQPSATVDEGNNWINMRWGPLSMTNPSLKGGTFANYGGGVPLGNYGLALGSPAIDSGTSNFAPTADFYGTSRPQGRAIDRGAVEFVAGSESGTLTPTSLAFGAVYIDSTSPAQTLFVTNTGTTPLALNLGALTGSGAGNYNVTLGTCSDPVPAGSGACTVLVQASPPPSASFGASNATLRLAGVLPAVSLGGTVHPYITSINPASGVRGAQVPITVTGPKMTGVNALVVSGAGITHGPLTVTATTVSTTLTISNGASLGSRTVTVTDGGQVSNAVPFTVNGATVTISAPTPAETTTPANTTTKNATITVSNASAATGPLTLTAAPTIAKVGTAGGTFSIGSGGTCVSGAVVNPGGSCTINVSYAPGTSTATATANVTVTGSGMATTTETGANFTAN